MYEFSVFEVSTFGSVTLTGFLETAPVCEPLPVVGALPAVVDSVDGCVESSVEEINEYCQKR